MTPAQLQEGARLLAAATPEKWHVDAEGNNITIRDKHSVPLAEMWMNGRTQRMTDAELIVWLRTHAAELIADAARYQWLRDAPHNNRVPHITQHPYSAAIDSIEYPYFVTVGLDAAIDAARASGTEGA